MSASALTLLIVGTGNVARALASRFAKTSHQVVLGSRDDETGQHVAKELGVRGGAATSFVAEADVIFLAVPFVNLSETLDGLGNIDGKTIVDCTNPLTSDYMQLTVGHSDSAGEICQRLAPRSKVVKAFNAIFAEVVSADMSFGAIAPQVFLAGNDAASKDRVAALVRDLGYDAVDTGGIECARYLEPLAELIIQLAYVQGLGTVVTPVILTASGASPDNH
ncbi:NADPH-dependent F420 reductase [Sinorhizobium meliloti]|uniref:NADPH-dependent F420 reductase n=1 Tax=Rhizobium meliloti TaxID=382 RepID=UPI000FD57DA3|nr:NAD(P)-binding domain-containing protein [Sinorhizobium meliloti]RVJ73222.1 NADP oxidoreductase [Sinorhizobium meliloti]